MLKEGGMDAADQQVVLEERDYEQILDRYLQGLAPQTRQSISLVVQELKRKGSSFKILVESLRVDAQLLRSALLPRPQPDQIQPASKPQPSQPLQSATTSSSSKQPSIPFKNPAEVVTPSAATRAVQNGAPSRIPSATRKPTLSRPPRPNAPRTEPTGTSPSTGAPITAPSPSAPTGSTRSPALVTSPKGNSPTSLKSETISTPSKALGEKDASVSPGGMSKTALAMAKVRAQLRMDEAEKKTQILQQRVAEVEAELAKAKAELVLHQEEHLKRKREFDDARAAIEEVSRAAKRRKTDEVDQPAPSIEQENDSASAAPLLGSKRPPTRLDGKAIWEERSKKARRSSAADAFNTFVPVPTPPPAAVQPQIDRPSFALSPTTPNPKSAIEEDNEFVLTSDGPIDIDTGPSKLPVVKRPSAPDGSALNAPADGATNAIPAALATASPSADDSTLLNPAEKAAALRALLVKKKAALESERMRERSCNATAEPAGQTPPLISKLTPTVSRETLKVHTTIDEPAKSLQALPNPAFPSTPLTGGLVHPKAVPLNPNPSETPTKPTGPNHSTVKLSAVAGGNTENEFKKGSPALTSSNGPSKSPLQPQALTRSQLKAAAKLNSNGKHPTPVRASASQNPRTGTPVEGKKPLVVRAQAAKPQTPTPVSRSTPGALIASFTARVTNTLSSNQSTTTSSQNTPDNDGRGRKTESSGRLSSGISANTGTATPPQATLANGVVMQRLASTVKPVSVEVSTPLAAAKMAAVRAGGSDGGNPPKTVEMAKRDKAHVAKAVESSLSGAQGAKITPGPGTMSFVSTNPTKKLQETGSPTVTSGNVAPPVDRVASAVIPSAVATKKQTQSIKPSSQPRPQNTPQEPPVRSPEKIVQKISPSSTSSGTQFEVEHKSNNGATRNNSSVYISELKLLLEAKKEKERNLQRNLQRQKELAKERAQNREAEELNRERIAAAKRREATSESTPDAATMAASAVCADTKHSTSGAEIAAVPDKAVVLFEGHRTAPGTKGAVATSLGESGTGDVVLKSLGVRITADILAKARMLAAAGNKSLQQQQQEQVALHPKRATGPADLRPRGTSPQETTNTVVSSGNVGLVSGPATVPGDAGAPVFELGSSPGVGSGHSSKVQNSSNGSAKHSQVDSGSRSVNLASGASTSSLLNASLLDRVVAAAAAASAPPPAPPAPPLQWQSQSAMLANAGPVHNMQQPQQQRLETQHAQPQAQQLPQQPPQQLLLQLQQQQLLQQQQQQQQYQQMLLLQHLQQQQQLQQQMQQPHQAPHHQQQQQLQQHQQRQEQQQQVHVQNYQQPMSGPQIPGNPYFAQFAAQLGMITGPPLQAGAVAAAAAGWLGPMRAPGGGGSLGPMGAGGGGGAATAAVAPGGMMQMMTAGNSIGAPLHGGGAAFQSHHQHHPHPSSRGRL